MNSNGSISSQSRLIGADRRNDRRYTPVEYDARNREGALERYHSFFRIGETLQQGIIRVCGEDRQSRCETKGSDIGEFIHHIRIGNLVLGNIQFYTETAGSNGLPYTVVNGKAYFLSPNEIIITPETSRFGMKDESGEVFVTANLPAFIRSGGGACPTSEQKALGLKCRVWNTATAEELAAYSAMEAAREPGMSEIQFLGAYLNVMQATADFSQLSFTGAVDQAARSMGTVAALGGGDVLSDEYGDSATRRYNKIVRAFNAKARRALGLNATPGASEWTPESLGNGRRAERPTQVREFVPQTLTFGKMRKKEIRPEPNGMEGPIFPIAGRIAAKARKETNRAKNADEINRTHGAKTAKILPKKAKAEPKAGLKKPELKDAAKKGRKTRKLAANAQGVNAKQLKFQAREKKDGKPREGWIQKDALNFKAAGKARAAIANPKSSATLCESGTAAGLLGRSRANLRDGHKPKTGPKVNELLESKPFARKPKPIAEPAARKAKKGTIDRITETKRKSEKQTRTDVKKRTETTAIGAKSEKRNIKKGRKDERVRLDSESLEETKLPKAKAKDKKKIAGSKGFPAKAVKPGTFEPLAYGFLPKINRVRVRRSGQAELRARAKETNGLPKQTKVNELFSESNKKRCEKAVPLVARAFVFRSAFAARVRNPGQANGKDAKVVKSRAIKDRSDGKIMPASTWSARRPQSGRRAA